MGRPLRIEYPGAWYHVTSRGNEQKDIFKSRADREKFLSYLESAAVRYGAVIHAYCLMGNHYHLLLETPSGNLSQIMRHTNGAYTTHFKVKPGGRDGIGVDGVCFAPVSHRAHQTPGQITPRFPPTIIESPES